MLLLSAGCLALGGCSAIKIAYNQSPELAFWYLDDYVDFNSEQSLQLKAELSRLQAWHRQTQLPGYVDQLQGFQQQAVSDATPAQVCTAFEAVRRGFFTALERAEPAAATLAMSLDAAQLANIEKRLDKGNAEYRKEFLEGSPQALRGRRIKQATKRAEMLYGRLEKAQVEVLERLLDQSGFDARRTYAERLRRQQDALQTLRTLTTTSASSGANSPANAAGSSATARSALRSLRDRTVTSPDKAYRAYADQLAQERCRMVAEFHNTTSAAQRQKAVETLRAYETDARTLMGHVS